MCYINGQIPVQIKTGFHPRRLRMKCVSKLLDTDLQIKFLCKWDWTIYLQDYLQPQIYIAYTALNQAFKISVVELKFGLLDNIRLQVACSRATK